MTDSEIERLRPIIEAFSKCVASPLIYLIVPLIFDHIFDLFSNFFNGIICSIATHGKPSINQSAVTA